MPQLVLQPLVENALRHGLAPRDAPGRLVIVVAAITLPHRTGAG